MMVIIGLIIIIFGGFPNAPWMALFGPGADIKWIKLDPLWAKIAGVMFIIAGFVDGLPLLIAAVVTLIIAMLRSAIRKDKHKDYDKIMAEFEELKNNKKD